jgi:hypothetical protein
LSFEPAFTPPIPLFQWYPQSKEILLNLSMKRVITHRCPPNP